MRTALYTFVCIFLLLSVSFAEEKFDCTNEQTMGQSMQRMMIGLTSEQQVKLQQSITAMYIAEGIAQMGKAEPYQIQQTVGKKLHGKTAKEIIKMAEKVRMKMGSMNN